MKSALASTASELPAVGSHSCSTPFDDGEKRRQPSESPACRQPRRPQRQRPVANVCLNDSPPAFTTLFPGERMARALFENPSNAF